jgi:hypothetical protein
MIDFSGPPGGLEKLFAQYDAIVAHHPPHPEAEQPAEDAPPWSSPEHAEAQPQEQSTAQPEAADEWIPSPPLTEKERAENQRKADLGYNPRKSWRDIEAERMEASEQRLRDDFERPSGATFAQDEAGLVNAYADKTAPGVFYDPQSRTEYVKGSVTARDWYDDVTKVPVWGDTRQSERYQQADKTYNDLIESGHPVDRVVGHSLGGSVALQMQKDHFIPRSRTFGAPVVDMRPFDRYYTKAEHYRHPLDPVSIFDRGATWGKFKPYAHTYTGFDDLQKA